MPVVSIALCSHVGGYNLPSFLEKTVDVDIEEDSESARVRGIREV